MYKWEFQGDNKATKGEVGKSEREVAARYTITYLGKVCCTFVQ